MARTIQVRHVPEELHRTLRVRAVAAGMSLSDYVLGEIVRVAERPPVGDVLARAASRRGKAAIGDVVQAVRSGRDRG